MTDIEQIELHDWQIDSLMTNNERYQKSVSAYYLHNWYHKVTEITFKTHIYPIDDINSFHLDVLPFDRCMVRYENKSPKDSEYWAPCTTYDEIKKLFNTSLRCRTNKGNYLCIRQWQDNIRGEFRCFWNRQLVAVADHSTHLLQSVDEIKNMIITYVSSISDKIPYIRCVLDIALTNDGFKLIEFNSWESNSGALPYDWIDDTALLYPTFTKEMIPLNFRSADGTFNDQIAVKNNDIIDVTNRCKTINGTIMNSPYPSNWLKTEMYLFVTTDIWLARFDLMNDTVLWKRGVYRFASLTETKNGTIMVKHHDNTQMQYNMDLSLVDKHMTSEYDKKRRQNTVDDTILQQLMNLNLRYGFVVKHDDKHYFYKLYVDNDDYHFMITPI